MMRRIAQILKSNGTEGELLISFIGTDPEEINLKEPVYVEFDGLPVPFFFEAFTRRGTSRALVHLTGVRSLRDADELAGRAMYVEGGEDNDGELDIIGWTVVDGKSGRPVGTVRDYEDIPGNLCIWVIPVIPSAGSVIPSAGSVIPSAAKESEFLLPLHDDLILDLNEDTRTLVLSIPEGLL